MVRTGIEKRNTGGCARVVPRPSKVPAHDLHGTGAVDGVRHKLAPDH